MRRVLTAVTSVCELHMVLCRPISRCPLCQICAACFQMCMIQLCDAHRCLSCDTDLRTQQNVQAPKPTGKSGLLALLDRASGQEPLALPPLAPHSATPTAVGKLNCHPRLQILKYKYFVWLSACVCISNQGSASQLPLGGNSRTSYRLQAGDAKA